MKLVRFAVLAAALAGGSRLVIACVGSDPGADISAPDGGGGTDATTDTGGGTDAGGTQDTGSTVDAADAADADDGAPKCPTTIPNVIVGVHCPDSPATNEQCQASSECCNQKLDGGPGRQCLSQGSVCGSMLAWWSCEAQTQCGSGKVCVANLFRRDGGCPNEFDIPSGPTGTGGDSYCYNAGSAPTGATHYELCDPNGGTQCGGSNKCTPAIMHFPETTKTFVIGVCLP